MPLSSAHPRKAMGTPFLITQDGGKHRLHPIALAESGTYTEAWLQDLIHAHPEILPIAQIEPAFGTPVSVAREIVCAHGIIDNFYVTPTGDLVLVETKLWRNVEARRKVLAQALDYVAALMAMSYAELESAVKKAGLAAPTLYALVADHPDALSEAAFFDAVSRNLKRGRMLVLAVGDGIREETEALAELVQHHMMAQFTLALVEVRTYRGPADGDIIAVPHTLAQTVMIDRGVLTFRDGAPVIEPPQAKASTAPKTITEAIFYEELAKKDPALPAAIKAFLAEAAELGVYPEFANSLNLKVDLAEAKKPLNVGYIARNGQLWTNPVNWAVGETVAMAYAQRLADCIGGKVASHDGIWLTTNGKSAPLVSSLLPAHKDAWIDAIRDLIKTYESQLQQDA